MEKRQIANLGFYIPSYIINRASSFQKLMLHISDDKNMYGRILLTLKEYLVEYSKVFDDILINLL